MPSKIKPYLVIFCALAFILAACSTDAAPPSVSGATAPGMDTAAAPESAVLFDEGDGWEPIIATDPSAPYVYAATTLKDEHCVETRDCPRWNMALRVSEDGGATWGDMSWICTCRSRAWVGDPQLRTDGSGSLHAAFLVTPGWTVLTTKSTDHGATWSKPIDLMPKDATWIDHPWLAVSPDGKDVHVGYSKTYENWIITSNDGGETWREPVQLNPKDEGYYFYESGTVAPDGTAYFFTPIYGCCPYGKLAYKTPIVGKVLRSTDHGKTWDQIEVATVPPPPEPLCRPGCGKERFGMLGGIATDADGNLVVAYNGRGPDATEGEQIWAITSSDQGATWSEPQAISPPGNVIAAFPAVAGTGDGDFRIMWTDDRNGADDQMNWNTYVSTSSDSGLTWSEGVDISAGTGYDYQSADGYDFFYGDYGDIQITNEGKTAAIWAEAGSYDGPGTTWMWLGTP